MTDARKFRLSLALIGVLVAVIAAMAYKFIVIGSSEKAADGRVTILLEPAERAFVLTEMRDLVAGVQGISDALSRDDMPGVAKAARGMGMAKSHDAPATIMGKLPLQFKTLAVGLHREFDTIALDAEAMRMPKHTLSQLSDALQKCVACHASYQFKAPPAQ
ncbi:MAG TPA: hypothetical protein VLN59_08955 [Burkholderiales bacterium]|nr:hypothetical protein [Burkholderiales bacterium]